MREYVQQTCDQALERLANGQVPLAELAKSMARVYNLPHALARLAGAVDGISWTDKFLGARCDSWNDGIPVTACYSDARGSRTREVDHHMFLPREIFASLHVREYWADQDQQWCQNHPILKESDWGDCVPIRLYGDGAEFTSSLLANQCCARKNIHDFNCALSCLNMCYHGEQTRQKILETIAWSLEALASGKYPANDPWGVPFSKSYEGHRFKKAGANLVETAGAATRGIFDGIQADLEFVKRILCLKRDLV
ncbi:ANK3 [Symbiodinium sp. CCMP2592]|nr:ANK3 [Symbiodinium sp. CCMP2592]